MLKKFLENSLSPISQAGLVVGGGLGTGVQGLESWQRGTLTEGKGAVWLTSLLRWLALEKSKSCLHYQKQMF
jgi:hypothetical protein